MSRLSPTLSGCRCSSSGPAKSSTQSVTPLQFKVFIKIFKIHDFNHPSGSEGGSLASAVT
jgi:hypothetical protein